MSPYLMLLLSEAGEAHGHHTCCGDFIQVVHSVCPKV